MSEALVVRPITKGLTRTIGEYTGVLADIEFLLSRSGQRICGGCSTQFTYCSPTEFVDQLTKSVSHDDVVDIDLVLNLLDREPESVVEEAIKRGFVRGRINSEEVRLEEWGGGEISEVSVTVDRIKGASPDLRTRILGAFTTAENLQAVQIKAGAFNSPLGTICPHCFAPDLVSVSSGMTVESFKEATIDQAEKLLIELDIPGRHPDLIILKDLQCRLRRAIELGLGEFRLNRQLGELSDGERYRLIMASRVFAEVHGLEYEFRCPGVNFFAEDAQKIEAHLDYLRNDCGAKVEALQLQACLFPNFVIENQLSITKLKADGAEFPIGPGLNASLQGINNLAGRSGAGKSKLLAAEFTGFKRVVRLSAGESIIFKGRTVGALLGLAKPLKEFYANHPQSKVLGLKLSSFSGLLPGEKSRSTVREYELVSTVKFKNLSYDRTLRADVAELLTSFRHFPRLGFRLRLLSELGLDSIKPIDRIRDFTPAVRRLLRLVETITTTPAEGTLFILDDMLVGLSPEQLRRVLNQLQQLCDRGATVITTNLPEL